MVTQASEAAARLVDPPELTFSIVTPRGLRGGMVLRTHNETQNDVFPVVYAPY